MTKKTIYIANDGTEFENKKECEQYETRYKILIDTPEVIFFDQNLKPLPKCNITDDDTWHKLFVESYYINIPSVECFDLLVKAYNEFLTDERFTDRVPTDNSKTGLWRYNGLEEYWENLIEIKDETDRIIEQANEIVLKEKENHEQKTEI